MSVRIKKLESYYYDKQNLQSVKLLENRMKKCQIGMYLYHVLPSYPNEAS